MFRSKHEKCDVKNYINNDKTRDDRSSVVNLWRPPDFENDFFSSEKSRPALNPRIINSCTRVSKYVCMCVHARYNLQFI